MPKASKPRGSGGWRFGAQSNTESRNNISNISTNAMDDSTITSLRGKKQHQRSSSYAKHERSRPHSGGGLLRNYVFNSQKYS